MERMTSRPIWKRSSTMAFSEKDADVSRELKKARKCKDLMSNLVFFIRVDIISKLVERIKHVALLKAAEIIGSKWIDHYRACKERILSRTRLKMSNC